MQVFEIYINMQVNGGANRTNTSQASLSVWVVHIHLHNMPLTLRVMQGLHLRRDIFIYFVAVIARFWTFDNDQKRFLQFSRYTTFFHGDVAVYRQLLEYVCYLPKVLSLLVDSQHSLR
ncbi:hypothetical protein BDR07DRAFT_1412905 [Suillus spraguei]|nr:hypothetical protein BDR07DRAFT_1412905 [Suillus spraguei]